jgi:hypothetical protein
MGAGKSKGNRNHRMNKSELFEIEVQAEELLVEQDLWMTRSHAKREVRGLTFSPGFMEHTVA